MFAELKRCNVSENRANELAGRTKQRPPDRLVGREPLGAPNALRLQLRLKLRAGAMESDEASVLDEASEKPVHDKIDTIGEAIMRQRWPEVLERDPYYNPNLSRERANFSLGS